MRRDDDDEDDDRPRRRRPPDEYDDYDDVPRSRRSHRMPGYDDIRDDYDDEYRPHRRSYRPHRGGIILTLAIIGLFCFGFILGTIAFVMAKTDLDAMNRHEMDPDGRGLTTAGMVIGLIGAILSVLLIVVRVALIRR
jgi:hypothetical protein